LKDSTNPNKSGFKSVNICSLAAKINSNYSPFKNPPSKYPFGQSIILYNPYKQHRLESTDLILSS
jgi:hypothetical protein